MAAEAIKYIKESTNAKTTINRFKWNKSLKNKINSSNDDNVTLTLSECVEFFETIQLFIQQPSRATSVVASEKVKENVVVVDDVVQNSEENIVVVEKIVDEVLEKSNEKVVDAEQSAENKIEKCINNILLDYDIKNSI
ncbi:hypothetical protein [Epinotia aporema granulovirus]|uniref:P78/83 n=1 Tax=Epinotia aporema granulovirus TaxID=166056 RepID=K4EQS2_9BBAC|nr:hypothetical protein [Epinotia aporema granulovirus]AER41431.1 hypothetical protein [Epinotia aporema granulovirus]